jgi:hypothetical protein
MVVPVFVRLPRRRRLRRNTCGPAIRFAAPLKRRVISALVHQLIGAGPDISYRCNLLARQAARRCLGSRAQQGFGIKVAASRIIENAIRYAIKRIARGVYSIAEKSIFGSENRTRGIVEHLPHHPEIPSHMMVRVVRNRISGNYTTRQNAGIFLKTSPFGAV